VAEAGFGLHLMESSFWDMVPCWVVGKEIRMTQRVVTVSSGATQLGISVHWSTSVSDTPGSWHIALLRLACLLGIYSVPGPVWAQPV
jgi:hypothetical protein